MHEIEYLFVYGTLRPVSENSNPILSFNFAKVQPFLRSHQPARLPKADLYDLGSFPAAIPGTGTLLGSILEITSAAFEILDPLERHPEVYVRTLVLAQTATGEEIEAWVYWASEALARSGKLIENGDWFTKDFDSNSPQSPNA